MVNLILVFSLEIKDQRSFFQAGELICEEFVRKYDECLIDGGVLVSAPAEATFNTIRFIVKKA